MEPKVSKSRFPLVSMFFSFVHTLYFVSDLYILPHIEFFSISLFSFEKAPTSAQNHRKAPKKRRNKRKKGNMRRKQANSFSPSYFIKHHYHKPQIFG